MVDLTADGNYGLANVVTRGRALLNLSAEPNFNATQRELVNLTVRTQNDRMDDLDGGANDELLSIVVGINSARDELDIDSITGRSLLKGVFSLNQVGDEDNYEEMTIYGAKVTKQESSSGPDTVIIDYPEEQIEPLVYVTAGTVTSQRVAGGGETVSITQIEVGAAVLASEVADVEAQNLIVVGGPCANAVAAEVMGNPEDCAEGFEEGKAKIKLIEQASGKVALLVAGYSAMDTRAACRVLADYDRYALSGDEVEVTYTTLESITVGEPAVMADESDDSDME
ncbi:S-layer protein [Candidatus Woesearchaeota archaeon]|nr:S-layer protein [Candidatus Woesearchaeota archaeon]